MTATSRSDKRYPTGASEHTTVDSGIASRKAAYQPHRHWRLHASRRSICRLHPSHWQHLEARTVITSRQRLRVPMGPETKDSTDLFPTQEGPWTSARHPKLRVVQLWIYRASRMLETIGRSHMRSRGVAGRNEGPTLCSILLPSSTVE
jgi:hypothetical protein